MRFFLFLALAGCGDDGVRHIVDSALTPTVTSSLAFATYPDGRGYAAGYFTTRTSLAPNCTLTEVGPCQIQTCTGTPPSRVGDSAGSVTIMGGEPPQSIELVPDASNLYGYPMSGALGFSFHEGTQVVFGATGATVPAFSGSLGFPRLPTMSAPTIGSTTPRDADLVFQWPTEATIDSASLSIVDSTQTYAVCGYADLPATTRELTVPAALLGMLQPGSISFAIGMYASTQVTSGAYTIELYAGGEPSAPNGASFEGALILQ